MYVHCNVRTILKSRRTTTCGCVKLGGELSLFILNHCCIDLRSDMTSAQDDTGSVDYEQIILSILSKDNEIPNTWDLACQLKIDHQILVGVVKSLLSDRYVTEDSLSTTYWVLTAEGEQVVEHGSPENQVFNMIPVENGLALTELQTALGDIAKIGLGVCMKNKWVKKNGDVVVRTIDSIVDETSVILNAVASLSIESIDKYEKELQNLKRRKLVQQVTRKSSKITKGPEFREVRVRKMADLSKAMLGNKAEVCVQYDHMSIGLYMNISIGNDTQ